MLESSTRHASSANMENFKSEVGIMFAEATLIDQTVVLEETIAWAIH